MFEKLKHDVKNDTDIKKSTEIGSLSSKKKEGYSLNRKNNKEVVNNDSEWDAKLDGYQKSLSGKEETIKQLTSQVDKSIQTMIAYYQKSLSEKDEIIKQLREQADRKKESADEYQNILKEKDKTISEKEDAIQQLTSRIYNLNVFTKEYEKGLSKKEETVSLGTSRLDDHNVTTLE